MNSRQIAGQYKSIQKRLGINQSKWDQIDFNEGNAKFDNQSTDMRFSSPEGRHVFKDDKTQLEFDSNLAKMKIASLPNFNVGVEHEAEGTTEKPDGSVIDNTQPTVNNNATIPGIQQSTAKSELAIAPLKEGSAGWRIQQDLISKGFKQGELDDLRINHQKWKEQRRKRNKNKNKCPTSISN